MFFTRVAQISRVLCADVQSLDSMARILKRDTNDMVGKALAANTWVANSLKYNPLGRSLSDYEEAARW